MTKNHIRIGDEILKILSENGGQANTDQYSEMVHTNNVTHKDFSFVRERLIQLDIIRYLGEQKYFIILTEEGDKAIKYGLEKYLLNKEKMQDSFKLKSNNIHIGDNYGNYSQSSDLSLKNNLYNNTKLAVNPTAPKEKTIKSYLVKTISAIIATIIGGLIVYWLTK